MQVSVKASRKINIIEQQGFKNIKTRKRRKIKIPYEILLRYMRMNELMDFENDEAGIFSITITGVK